MNKLSLITLTLLLYLFSFSNPLYALDEKLIPKHNFSICAIFKNEAYHLKEWIEYHRVIGVDHFYLYNFESCDKYKEVLDPYIEQNIVTLVNWINYTKGMENDLLFFMLGDKILAYENAIKYLALNKTVWLAFVDVNEFLVPPSGSNLLEILKKYSNFSAVTLQSDFFDASKIIPLSAKKLVIENFGFALPVINIPEKTIEKTIFKPDQVVHFYWPPYKFIFKNDQSEIKLSKNELRINQYTNRNLAYFYHGKVKDKLQLGTRVLGEEEKKKLLERYEIQDSEQAINRFIPEVRKRMGLSSIMD